MSKKSNMLFGKPIKFDPNNSCEGSCFMQRNSMEIGNQSKMSL